jgi:hypothetical protein
MTAARAAKLDALGFAWELSAAAISKQRSEGRRDDAGWEVQLAKLKKYKRKHGGCNVPQGWAEDPPLGRWVKTQRQGKRALDRGEPSEGMTAARVTQLNALNFWKPAAAAKERPAAFVKAAPSRSREAATRAPARAAERAAAAAGRDQPAEFGPSAVARHPPGARVARLFGDGRWYDGTVLEAPWPPRHRWSQWRRVRFDDGVTLHVDTDAGPLQFRSLCTRGKRMRAQPVEEPAARGGRSTGPGGLGPETLRYRTIRTHEQCFVAHTGAKYRSLIVLSVLHH